VNTVLRLLMMDSKSLLKQVEYFTKISLRNSASSSLLLKENITLHGPLNVRYSSWQAWNPYMFRHRGPIPRSLLEKRNRSPKRWSRYWCRYWSPLLERSKY